MSTSWMSILALHSHNISMPFVLHQWHVTQVYLKYILVIYCYESVCVCAWLFSIYVLHYQQRISIVSWVLIFFCLLMTNGISHSWPVCCFPVNFCLLKQRIMKWTNNSSRITLLIQTALLFELHSFEQIISLMNQGAGTYRQETEGANTNIMIFFFKVYLI